MNDELARKAEKTLDILEETHPDARIYLDFDGPLQLLLATILAAQCTDERVNEITPDFFDKFPSAQAVAEADLPELEKMVRPTGFYRRKAKSLKKCCSALVEEHEGEVPDSLEELTELPGVGRKTANVVLANAYDQQAVAVDTHVGRVSRRLGLAEGKNADKIEKQLCEVIPGKRWTRATHLLGTHGRRICTSQKPDCENCPVNTLCDCYQKAKT